MGPHLTLAMQHLRHLSLVDILPHVFRIDTDKISLEDVGSINVEWKAFASASNEGRT